VIAGFASMGLPGFSGFAAELRVLIGSWDSFPTFAVVAGLGIVIGVAYTLRVMHKAFFGEAQEESQDSAKSSPEAHAEMEPITAPEKMGAFLLVITTLAIGLFPGILLKLINSSYSSPLFDGLKKWGSF